MAEDERRRDFVRKLGHFRTTLPLDEQQMLDALVLHAESAKPLQGVEGYGWFFGNDAANPSYYSGDSPEAVAPGETSGWWTMYSSGNNPFRS
jgi:hypothetical protein